MLLNEYIECLLESRRERRSEEKKQYIESMLKKIEESIIKAIAIVKEKHPEWKKYFDMYDAEFGYRFYDYKDGKKVYFELILGDEEAKTTLSQYLEYVGKIVESKLPVTVTYGDGDEGCIYIKY